MSTLIETSNRVVWREGALLAPQHLQQQERHLLSQIQLCFSTSRPYPWGILKIDIDHNAAMQGEFQLNTLHAMMPDGLYVSCGDKDPAPASRSFAQSFHSLDSTLLVYLGIPLEKPGVPSFDESPLDQNQDDRKTRYCVRAEEIYDQTQERERNEIQTASPRCRILFGDESKDDYMCMPIARVIRSSGSYKLDPSFVPPCLCISANTAFSQRTKDLLVTARNRLQSLQEHRRQRGAAGFEVNARDTAIYMWLFALGSRMPQLQTTLDTPNLSPFELFKELYGMAGQLAVLVPKYGELPKLEYHHNDLQASFDPLFDLLHELLSFAFQKSFKSLALNGREDGMWLAEVKDDLLTLKGDYVLAVKSTLPDQDVARRLPELAKLACYSEVTGLVHSALRGVPLAAMHRPPDSIPYRSDTIYFSIDRSSEHWQKITRDKNIALYIGSPFDSQNLEVELLVGLEDSRESIISA